MGQFHNQPDFATEAKLVIIGTTDVEGSVLYIGTGGDIEVSLIGSPSEYVVFKNVATGSFLPVIVSDILASDRTTVSNVIAVK